MPLGITVSDKVAEISHHANFRCIGLSEINYRIERCLRAQASLDLFLPSSAIFWSRAWITILKYTQDAIRTLR